MTTPTPVDREVARADLRPAPDVQPFALAGFLRDAGFVEVHQGDAIVYRPADAADEPAWTGVYGSNG